MGLCSCVHLARTPETWPGSWDVACTDGCRCEGSCCSIPAPCAAWPVALCVGVSRLETLLWLERMRKGCCREAFPVLCLCCSHFPQQEALVLLQTQIRRLVNVALVFLHHWLLPSEPMSVEKLSMGAEIPLTALHLPFPVALCTRLDC